MPYLSGGYFNKWWEHLDPSFKSLFTQLPSVFVSVRKSLIPTQSKPLTDAGSVICANVSWQVSWHCVALTRPCGHAGHSHLHWRREHHLLHDDRFNVQQRHRAPLKDFSIHPWLPWRQSLLLSSNWWIGFATPMGVWSERGGKSLDELCKGAAP